MIGLSGIESELTGFLIILFDTLIVLVILPFLYAFAKRMRDVEKETYFLLHHFKIERPEKDF